MLRFGIGIQPGARSDFLIAASLPVVFGFAQLVEFICLGLVAHIWLSACDSLFALKRKLLAGDALMFELFN